ncbi:MAG: tRNA pseudouridine(13) synthase TruD, partial [Myxococcales bacterium]|nr:tRNA pseudouridine(13) synthase TruD [Myxococcales bacterium]
VNATFKAEPDDFRVDELPLYEALGEGPHVYLTLERRGQTTRELALELQRLFGLGEVDVGYAGMKDKLALATQAFSLHLPNIALDEVRRRVESEMAVALVALTRHRNKLRRGHLAGNRFTITLRCSAEPERELATAARLIEELRAAELPNFYGAQRFGVDQRNAMRGESILRRGHRPRSFKERLFVNAFQSALFNVWLAERIARGDYARILPGDVAQKRTSGGIFDVVPDERDEAQARFDSGEIGYTGPMYGAKMREATADAGARERELLARSGIEEGAFRRAKLDGTRRIARVALDDAFVATDEAGIRLVLTLPKGCYATRVVHELLKPNDPQLATGLEADEDS